MKKEVNWQHTFKPSITDPKRCHPCGRLLTNVHSDPIHTFKQLSIVTGWQHIDIHWRDRYEPASIIREPNVPVNDLDKQRAI